MKIANIPATPSVEIRRHIRRETGGQVGHKATFAGFSSFGAGALLVLLIAAVIVAWSPRYWAVSLLHVGVFTLGLAWVIHAQFAASAPYARWNFLYIPMAVTGLWGVVQLAAGTSVYRFQTSRALLYWSSNAVVMFLAAQFLSRTRVRDKFLIGLASFMGLIAVIGILQYFTSPYRIYWTFPIGTHVKAVGPFVYRNQFAAMVELVLPIALYHVMGRRRQRWAFAVLAGILFAVVVATASRMGTLLVACELVLVFVLGWRKHLVSGRSLIIALGQVLAMTVVFTLAVGYQDVWSRFHETNPYALRGKLADSTVQMIRTRPLMGYGLGTWQTVYPQFATFDNSMFANEAHNDWAQWSAEGGIFFGLALAAVALGSVFLAWRNIWGVGVVFVFIHSFIDYPTHEPVIGAVLFVLIGAMMATDVGKGRRGRVRTVEK